MCRHLAAVLLVLISSSMAHAQYYGGGWGGGYHSSTVQEGAARGFADVVRAQGMNNLLNSEAAKNLEAARREDIENRVRATQAYFDIRRINQEYRESQRPQPLSMEQYVRLAREKAPDRLSVSQLDPLSGRLSWPLALRDAAYAEDRALLEQLFKERASGLGVNYLEIDAAAERLQAKLAADLERFKPDDYIRANSFLDSLSYELRLAQR
ncbi:MAG: hypothetical protein WD872_18625 [Pirellulaceae bacterium]